MNDSTNSNAAIGGSPRFSLLRQQLPALVPATLLPVFIRKGWAGKPASRRGELDGPVRIHRSKISGFNMNAFIFMIVFLSLGSFNVPSLLAESRANLFEDFRGNPATNGWGIFGHTNLFAWNATNQNVEVTWDSSKPNSYFYKPLGYTLTRDESKFEFYFDLRLRDIAIGTTTNKPYTFQIAVGLLNFRQATNAGFLRGTGTDSPNLFEVAYFPDSGFGATISPTVISSNNQFATAFILREVTTNDLFKFEMRVGEDGGRVFARITRNGQFYDSQIFFFPTNFHFSLDTVAIASYSDEGQLP